MTRVKESVAVAIFDPDDANRLLVVQRSDNDEDLPNVWGLPAASLGKGESFEDAVRRTGRDKLGVELRPIRELRRGNNQRAGYTLNMRLFEAVIERGNPAVPQAVQGITQYRYWAWDSVERLRPGAEAGSLCCRLLADHLHLFPL